jgi:hypothetical protein
MEKQSEPKNKEDQPEDDMNEEKQSELDPDKLPANLRKFHGCFDDAPKSYSTKEIGEDTEKLRRSERIKQNRPSTTPTSSSSPDSDPPVTPTSLNPSTSTESPSSTQEPPRRKKK